MPLIRIYDVLHEQHVKNTAMLLGALAILTDELVRVDPPPFEASEIPLFLSRVQTDRLFSVSREAENTEETGSA